MADSFLLMFILLIISVFVHTVAHVLKSEDSFVEFVLFFHISMGYEDLGHLIKLAQQARLPSESSGQFK